MSRKSGLGRSGFREVNTLTFSVTFADPRGRAILPASRLYLSFLFHKEARQEELIYTKSRQHWILNLRLTAGLRGRRPELTVSAFIGGG